MSCRSPLTVPMAAVATLLDGVFNHCGRGFFAFHDLLENESHSPYTDWFHVRRFPLHAYGPGESDNYLAWWKFKSLPKFNTANPLVRKYLFGVAEHWVRQGIDGWRLDVPNEIDDDSFWAEFREVVKAANPEAYLVGEIWDGDPRWVSPGHFDGLLNYPLRELILGYVGGDGLKAGECGRRTVEFLARYAPENAFAHYLPLGSHDTERLRTMCGGERRGQGAWIKANGAIQIVSEPHQSRSISAMIRRCLSTAPPAASSTAAASPCNGFPERSLPGFAAPR